MKEEEIVNELKSRFNVDGYVQRERRVWVSVDKDKLMDVCKFIRKKGFSHLSSISVTDWLKDNEFELTYHLWSYEDKLLLTIKTRIRRDNPVIETVCQIWGESAQVHEREMHELFGIEFRGNPDLSPLFLEDWRGPPPFRKDFDWRDYVRGEFYSKENERESVYFEEG